MTSGLYTIAAWFHQKAVLGSIPDILFLNHDGKSEALRFHNKSYCKYIHTVKSSEANLRMSTLKYVLSAYLIPRYAWQLVASAVVKDTMPIWFRPVQYQGNIFASLIVDRRKLLEDEETWILELGSFGNILDMASGGSMNRKCFAFDASRIVFSDVAIY